ncbi:glycerophosphodiester phosphodiesterase family protein [Rhizobium sp. 0TCS1.26]|uniref:glycerophosphodiester phosphodiesterase n=1 Tax=Rhizobium sp. 0TCS1.26 TaxID=3142623 RepID=UPI003D2CDAF4
MIKIIAHRGYSARFRENSPTAWRAAAEAGADVVEVDIRFTADGCAVCVHDADLHRLAGRHEAIATVDYAALSGLTAGGEPLAPLFADALAAVPVDTALLLDVKDESPRSLYRLHGLVTDAVGRDIIFGLHRIDSVRFMASRGHSRILALTLDRDEGQAFIDAGANIVRVWEADVSTERLAPLLARSVPVWSTVGDKGMKTQSGAERLVGDFDAENLRRIAALGVTGFLVNDPLGARAALGANS